MLNWKTIRDSQYKSREQRLEKELSLATELTSQREIYEQIEFEDIVDPIDDKEAFFRHKQAMAMRYFRMWKIEKDINKRNKLVDYYNYMMVQHTR